MQRQFRARALARALVVVSAFALPALAAAQNAQFTATGSTTHARYGHSATQLPNGKVLIAAGFPYDQTAELYDPATGSYTATGSMSIAGGVDHTATLLPSGKVLVAGGAGSYGGTAGAELYDPATGTFSATGTMSMVRWGHTATRLPNGKVLIAGGGVWLGSSWTASSSAEVYDPATGTFSPTGNLTVGRYRHSAALLPNGKVLLVGGTRQVGAYYGAPWACLASAELYDPVTGQFTATGGMSVARNGATVTVLGNGKVLVAGGNPYDGANGVPIASAELYDPATGAFAVTGTLLSGREGHTATVLPTGKVLVAGGAVRRWDGYILPNETTELYDPATGLFTAGPSMTVPRSSFTATLLVATGRVLVTAGYISPDHSTAASDLYGNPLACY
jgi:hypothetical protein